MAVADQSLQDDLKPDSRGHNLLVAHDVEIDPTALIGANVILNRGVRIGANVTIKHNCVIGERPTLSIASRTHEPPIAETVIGTGATICNGVVIFDGATIGEEAIIGDQGYVRESSTIGAYAVIGQGCNVGAGSSIGARTRIQGGSIVLPGMIIEEDVFIGVLLGGATGHAMGRVANPERHPIILRRGSRIGSCVCLMPGVEVGEEAYVGAGAVVLESIPAGTKVAGVPARAIGVVDDI